MSSWPRSSTSQCPAGAKLCLLRDLPGHRLPLQRMRIPRCGASSSAGSGRGEPAGGAPAATIPGSKNHTRPGSDKEARANPREPSETRRLLGAPQAKKPVPGFQGAWCFFFFFCTLRHKLIDRTPSYPRRFVSLSSGAPTGGAGGVPGALLGGQCLCKGSP